MGASAESLEALIRSGFVIRFHSGIIVMTHWNMANTRRADREAKLRFPEEYSQLQVYKTGVYSMREDGGMTAGTQWDDNGRLSISSSLASILFCELQNRFQGFQVKGTSYLRG